jgi:hypothetical protein
MMKAPFYCDTLSSSERKWMNFFRCINRLVRVASEISTYWSAEALGFDMNAELLGGLGLQNATHLGSPPHRSQLTTSPSLESWIAPKGQAARHSRQLVHCS